MKKIFKALAVIGVSAALCAPLAACGEDTAKTEQEKIYDAYVVYAEAAGEEPLSYEEWLESVQGEKGEKGDKGDQGEKGDQGAAGAAGEDGVGIETVSSVYTYDAAADAFYTEITFALTDGASYTAKVPAAEDASLECVADSAAEIAALMGKGFEKIALGADLEMNLTIEKEQTLTLDLNGYTLTNESSHTIYNWGTLTVSDTVGGGVVDNVTHAKAALYNEVGAKAVLNGGTFTRSKENGISADDNGGNSWYTMLNHGTMTINDGVTVSQNGRHSSLFDNGWSAGAQNTTKVPSVLVINGGHFSGGLNTIKNDDWGNLTIKGGTFENVTQAVVLNWNVAAIEGGTFLASEEAQAIILNGYLDAEMDKGELTIRDLTYSGTKLIENMGGSTNGGMITVYGEEVFNAVDAMSGTKKIVLAGGSYTTDPTADKDYVSVADGYKLVEQDGAWVVVRDNAE